jgi:excisionase family DNA binding protein
MEEGVAVEELITLDELSRVLKVSRTTIDRWRREGLPYEKVGRGVRFQQEKALGWIRQNKGLGNN